MSTCNGLPLFSVIFHFLIQAVVLPMALWRLSSYFEGCDCCVNSKHDHNDFRKREYIIHNMYSSGPKVLLCGTMARMLRVLYVVELKCWLQTVYLWRGGNHRAIIIRDNSTKSVKWSTMLYSNESIAHISRKIAGQNFSHLEALLLTDATQEFVQ